MAGPKKARGSAPNPYLALKNGEIAPLYVVDGVAILASEFVRAVRAAVFPPGSMGEDFNYERFSGKDSKTTVGRLLDAAKTLPAFAPRRLVVLTQADSLLPAKAEDANEALIAYAQNPSPTTTLVLAADGKFDARTKVYKALKKHGAVARFEEPTERTMPGLVADRAEELGLAIAADAKRALADAVGTDLIAMRSALENLSLYIGDRKKVERADVDAVVPSVAEEKIFDLVDAIVDGHQARVMAGLDTLLGAQREPALKLLALVARQYRLLVRARAELDAGTSPGALASKLGIPPFVVDRLVRQASAGAPDRFARGLVSIATTDWRLKGGTRQVEDIRVFERLVLALTRDEVALPEPARGRVG